MTEENENILWDRLVDGELSAPERQELLASLDNREDGWRRCALAFLEAQSWGHQFQSMLVDTDNEQPVATAVQEQDSTRFHAGHWLAVAACLLVAFTLGRSLPSGSDAAPGDAQVAETDSLENEPAEEPVPHAPSNQEAITLLVQDTEGRNRRVQVPLMDVVTLDEQFGKSLPAQLRERFRNNGFDLERRRRFAPMFFEQDQQLVPMVVPVDDTYVVPVSRPIY